MDCRFQVRSITVAARPFGDGLSVAESVREQETVEAEVVRKLDAARLTFALECTDLEAIPVSRADGFCAALSKAPPEPSSPHSTGDTDLPSPVAVTELLPDPGAGPELGPSADVRIPSDVVLEAFGVFTPGAHSVSAIVNDPDAQRDPSACGVKLIATFPTVELEVAGEAQSSITLGDRTAEAAHRAMKDNGGAQGGHRSASAMGDGSVNATTGQGPDYSASVRRAHQDSLENDSPPSSSNASGVSSQLSIDPRELLLGSTVNDFTDGSAASVSGPMRLTVDCFGAEGPATGFVVIGVARKTINHLVKPSHLSLSAESRSRVRSPVMIDVTVEAEIAIRVAPATVSSIAEYFAGSWLPQVYALATEPVAQRWQRVQAALVTAREIHALSSRAAVETRRQRTLRVAVTGAGGLVDSDMFGDADPFVEIALARRASAATLGTAQPHQHLHLAPGEYELFDGEAPSDSKRARRTPVAARPNPRWTSDNVFTWDLEALGALRPCDTDARRDAAQRAVVEVRVMDEDMFSNDLMGRGFVSVAAVMEAFARGGSEGAEKGESSPPARRVRLELRDNKSAAGWVELEVLAAPPATWLEEDDSSADKEGDRAVVSSGTAEEEPDTATSSYDDDDFEVEDDGRPAAPDSKTATEAADGGDAAPSDDCDEDEQPAASDDREVTVTTAMLEAYIRLLQAEARAAISRRVAVWAQREQELAAGENVANYRYQNRYSHEGCHATTQPLANLMAGPTTGASPAASRPGTRETSRSKSERRKTHAGVSDDWVKKPMPHPSNRTSSGRVFRRPENAPPVSQFRTSMLSPSRIPIDAVGVAWRNESLFKAGPQSTRWLPAIGFGVAMTADDAEEEAARLLRDRARDEESRVVPYGAKLVPYRPRPPPVDSRSRAALKPTEVAAARQSSVLSPPWAGGTDAAGRPTGGAGPHSARSKRHAPRRPPGGAATSRQGSARPRHRDDDDLVDEGELTPRDASASRTPPADEESHPHGGGHEDTHDDGDEDAKKQRAAERQAAYRENALRLAGVRPVYHHHTPQHRDHDGAAAEEDPDLEVLARSPRQSPTQDHQTDGSSATGGSPRRRHNNGPNPARLYVAPMANPGERTKALKAELRQLRTANRRSGATARR